VRALRARVPSLRVALTRPQSGRKLASQIQRQTTCASACGSSVNSTRVICASPVGLPNEKQSAALARRLDHAEAGARGPVEPSHVKTTSPRTQIDAACVPNHAPSWSACVRASPDPALAVRADDLRRLSRDIQGTFSWLATKWLHIWLLRYSATRRLQFHSTRRR